MSSHNSSVGAPPSAAQPWTAAEFAREEAILAGHAAAFRDRLLTHVGAHLKEECGATIVSEEWIDAAYHFVLDELSSRESRDDCFTEELESAREAAKRSLKTEIDKKLPNSIPTEREIFMHAHELAQCVVSNWVAMIKTLRRTTKLAPEQPLQLNDQWLPAGGTKKQVLLGVAAFSADPEVVWTKWQQHLTDEIYEASSLPLSARLHLRRFDSSCEVLGSAAPARVPTLASVDVVVSKMLQVASESTAHMSETNPTLQARLELEADVSAARNAAAHIVSKPEDPLADSARYFEKDPSLAHDFAKQVLREWTEFIERSETRPSDPAFDWLTTAPRYPCLVEDTDQALDTLKARVSEATQQPWKRMHRIAKLTTVYAKAAQNGATIKNLAQENDHQQGFNQAVAPNNDMLRIASSVARYALKVSAG
jgi:hypothetical protein